MSTTASFASWKDRILFWLITTGLSTGAAAIVGWGVWMTVGRMASPSREEVRVMIQTSAPYVRDKRLIMDHLDRTEKTTIVTGKQ